MKLLTTILTVLALTASLWAQPYSSSTQQNFRDYIRSGSGLNVGLLDPSKVTVSHDVQMGYSSFGGGSAMTSLYATTLKYRISDPLSLSFTLGLSGSRYNFGKTPYSSTDFLGGVALDYRPTNGFRLHLQIDHGPLGYSGYDRYGLGGSYSRYGLDGVSR